MIFWGLGSLACGLSSTVAMLGASRLLLGFGMGMEFPVAQSMVSEIIPAERRGRYIAYLEGFWPLGFIASGLLIYVVLSVADWHWVFILQAIPALFVLVIRRYVPESPRWLAAHGHSERAETVMQEIESKVAARLGGKALPAPRPQPLAAPAGVDIATLFSGIYARRTTMLWMLWFFALLGFYGLTTWLVALLQAKGLTLSKSAFYTILISLAGIPGFLFSAWFVESWGCKGTLTLNLIGGLSPATSMAAPRTRPNSSSRACACSSSFSACGRRSTPTRRSFIRRRCEPPERASPPRSAASVR